MTLFEIPLIKSKYYEFSVPLDGIIFNFEFCWNERAERFFISIFDSEKNLIIASVPAVLKIPLFYGIKEKKLPKGKLIFIDTTNSLKKHNFEDFGTKIKLLYEGNN